MSDARLELEFSPITLPLLHLGSQLGICIHSIGSVSENVVYRPPVSALESGHGWGGALWLNRPLLEAPPDILGDREAELLGILIQALSPHHPGP